MNYQSYVSETSGDRILVVDDAPDNILLLETILEVEGYQIRVAANGHQALAEIEKSPPDLLLLDVMMPGMDGYEVTRRIRSNANLPFFPILLVSAHEEASVVKGLDLGANDFIRKPIEIDELLARVRSLLRVKHRLKSQNSNASHYSMA